MRPGRERAAGDVAGSSASRPLDSKRRRRGAAGELARGRDAYARRQWDDAYHLLSAADRASPLAVDDLERLSWSAALSGHDEDVEAWFERVHNECVIRGDALRAGRAAFWMGMRLISTGAPARAGGWLSRARRLIERQPEPCVEKGYLLISAAHRSLSSGDPQAAYETAMNAVAVGERFGDPDLVALASNVQGQALITRGQTTEGLAVLDEAMVAVTAGELSPVVTGVLYCSVISSCRRVFALDRAREWTTALSRWCEGQPQLAAFTGTCLVHRAEIMQLGGAWRDALAEARRASNCSSSTADRVTAAEAQYQQAEIHRLRGEFDQAEEAYRSASRLGREPQPGLALLRLAQGRREAAAGAIQRVLGATGDRLSRVRLLPACVEVMLACEYLDEARSACIELEDAARVVHIDVLGALANHARGALQLAEGDAQAALPALRHAFDVWQQVGAPYIAARLRVLVALACRALGDEDTAALELAAARAVFADLGARPDIQRIDSLLERRPPGGRGALTPRELQVLRLVAAGKTNRAIANELALSEKTVDRHVSNIFVKIDVPSRAGATAYAYEHRLI
ncbi:MAG: LuxR C-terminal-related transcriptional regulator [Betaproteobacteria bacterium]